MTFYDPYEKRFKFGMWHIIDEMKRKYHVMQTDPPKHRFNRPHCDCLGGLIYMAFDPPDDCRFRFEHDDEIAELPHHALEIMVKEATR